jgi:hypothetical protein
VEVVQIEQGQVVPATRVRLAEGVEPSGAVAVTTAACVNDTVPAWAWKVALVYPAATITLAGTVSVESEDARLTEAPPLGAALLSVTVQDALPLDAIDAGLHIRLAGDVGAASTMPNRFDATPQVTVTVAVVSDRTENDPTLASKVAEVVLCPCRHLSSWPGRTRGSPEQPGLSA